jgi:hypothetical protein
MKLPIGHRLTLSGYEVEVMSDKMGSCAFCPIREATRKRFCNKGCWNVLESYHELKLIKDLRPDRKGG